MNARDDVARALDLIEAYGADPARWPPAAHGLAEAVGSDPALAAAREEAKRLDSLLAACGELSPDSALIGRVILQADMTRRRSLRLKTWGMLAALAGLGLAGAATGAAAMAVLSPAAPSYELYDLPTAFGDGQGFAGGLE